MTRKRGTAAERSCGQTGRAPKPAWTKPKKSGGGVGRAGCTVNRAGAAPLMVDAELLRQRVDSLVEAVKPRASDKVMVAFSGSGAAGTTCEWHLGRVVRVIDDLSGHGMASFLVRFSSGSGGHEEFVVPVHSRARDVNGGAGWCPAATHAKGGELASDSAKALVVAPSVLRQ